MIFFYKSFLAIHNEPENVNFLWERCNLYEQIGDRKKALAGYELILKQLRNPEDGEKCVEMSREISKVISFYYYYYFFLLALKFMLFCCIK